MSRNTSRHPRLVLAFACALALAGASNVAAAATKASSAKAQTASGANKRPAKVKFTAAPSSETPAARQQRLKRECKGRPNAGMCLGHTR